MLIIIKIIIKNSKQYNMKTFIFMVFKKRGVKGLEEENISNHYAI